MNLQLIANMSAEEARHYIFAEMEEQPTFDFSKIKERYQPTCTLSFCIACYLCGLAGKDNVLAVIRGGGDVKDFLYNVSFNSEDSAEAILWVLHKHLKNKNMSTDTPLKNYSLNGDMATQFNESQQAAQEPDFEWLSEVARGR